MRRVTYDSNIWISALQFGGRMRAVLQMAIDKEIEVAISEPIVQETLRILRDKFGWSDERLQGAEATMNLHATKVTPTQALNVVPGDADENRIIECAVASGSEAI